MIQEIGREGVGRRTVSTAVYIVVVATSESSYSGAYLKVLVVTLRSYGPSSSSPTHPPFLQTDCTHSSSDRLEDDEWSYYEQRYEAAF